jgi:hypothetical protein
MEAYPDWVSAIRKKQAETSVPVPTPKPKTWQEIQQEYQAQQKDEADKAAADKAAYDAIPYSKHLQDARDQVNTLKNYKPVPIDLNSDQSKYLISKGLNPNLQAILPNVQHQQALDAATAKLRQVQVDHIVSQLEDTSKKYKYSWKGNLPAATHESNVANMLVDQGVTDLANVKYDKTGHYLMNTENGNNLSWYHHKDTPATSLQNEGQFGWSAKGEGRTDYLVQKDAQGNPVFYPKWHDESPGGLGGFLIDAIPAVVGFATGQPELAALASVASGAIQGKDVGDIIKNGVINYASGNIGNLAANAATSSLPMLGNATLTNAAADALGGAAAGATNSLLRGNGLSGALPGAITGGVTSGVNALANTVNSGLKDIGVSPTVANATTNITAGALAPYIATGGNTNAALNGATNAAFNTAGQIVGNEVNSSLPPGVVNNFASGAANSIVSGGLNQLINSPNSSQQNNLSQHIASTSINNPSGLTQATANSNPTMTATNAANTAAINQTVNPSTVTTPNVLSQQIASIDPKLLQLAQKAATNSVYAPSTVSGGLSQINPLSFSTEYAPTGLMPSGQARPNVSVAESNEMAMLKRLGITT